MIEETILNYLKDEFQQAQINIPVYMQVPETAKNPNGSAFVVIEKTGSSFENWIFNSTVAIQSYAPTLYEAASLNETIVKIMLGIISEDEITKIDINSDYNFTNPNTKQPRYQAVFSITHYYKDE